MAQLAEHIPSVLSVSSVVNHTSDPDGGVGLLHEPQHVADIGRGVILGRNSRQHRHFCRRQTAKENWGGSPHVLRRAADENIPTYKHEARASVAETHLLAACWYFLNRRSPKK